MDVFVRCPLHQRGNRISWYTKIALYIWCGLCLERVYVHHQIRCIYMCVSCCNQTIGYHHRVQYSFESWSLFFTFWVETLFFSNYMVPFFVLQFSSYILFFATYVSWWPFLHAGHAHVAEALRVPLHVFFTMPWTWVLFFNKVIRQQGARLNEVYAIFLFFNVCSVCLCSPTSEFPHPLSQVHHSAANRVREHICYCVMLADNNKIVIDFEMDFVFWVSLQLSYQVVDSLIWWGIRDIVNDFRKKKLKLRPITYLSGPQLSASKVPTGYIWSPHLVPKPKGAQSLFLIIREVADICAICCVDDTVNALFIQILVVLCRLGTLDWCGWILFSEHVSRL